MDGYKLKRVLSKYEAILQAHYGLEKMPDSRYDRPCVEVDHSWMMKHAAWMCRQARCHADNGKIEKAMRWLGFIQAVMWFDNLRTLDDLKHDSMPDEEKP